MWGGWHAQELMHAHKGRDVVAVLSYNVLCVVGRLWEVVSRTYQEACVVVFCDVCAFCCVYLCFMRVLVAVAHRMQDIPLLFHTLC